MSAPGTDSLNFLICSICPGLTDYRPQRGVDDDIPIAVTEGDQLIHMAQGDQFHRLLFVGQVETTTGVVLNIICTLLKYHLINLIEI